MSNYLPSANSIYRLTRTQFNLLFRLAADHLTFHRAIVYGPGGYTGDMATFLPWTKLKYCHEK